MVIKMGAVTEYVSMKYGRRTATLEKTVTLGAAVVRVLENNPNRFAWAIFNLSGANIAYLGFTAAVSAANGLQINPNGGSITMSADQDLELPTHEMHGLASAAATTIFVFETVAVE
jgi:hypothetical protein